MIDQASSVTTGRPPVSRRQVRTIAIGLAAAVALVAVLGAPYAFSAATLRGEIAAQLRSTIGLAITTGGTVRFDLLPRPHVVAKGLHISDPSDTLSIEASELDGNIRLLPLIVGRVELTGVTLVRPHLTIDLDGHAMPSDSTIGRAMHALSPIDPSVQQSLGTLTLLDGTAILKSRRIARPPSFAAVNVTIDWPNLGSPATLTGSVEVEKTAADIAAWIAQPSNLMRGDHSAVTLSIHSTPLDLVASGDLVSAGPSTFRGRLSADAPSASALIAAAPAPFANLTLASDATLVLDSDGRGSLDLPNLHLHADDNDYEGTLAVQTGAKPMVSGTLACDQLNLASFLDNVPPMVGPDQNWTSTPLGAPPGQGLGLDLRISASHLRVAAITIDDAALAVMTRNDRTEVGLIDGKVYGGSVNGHLSFGPVSFGQGEPGVNVRGAGALEDIDAASLSWDAFGRQLAAGSLSGSVTLEASGASPAALMASLRGSAKADLRDGELSTIDLGRALHTIPTSDGAALEAGRTPLESFDLGLRIVDGLATIEHGAMRGADATLALGGTIDLGRRHIDVTAAASAPDASGRAEIDLAGPFGRILARATAAAPQPAQ